MNVCAVCKTAASPSVVPRTLCRRRSVAPNAAQHLRVGRLFVVTTNIDAQRTAVWNTGAAIFRRICGDSGQSILLTICNQQRLMR
jgi:hypothetical protein